MMSAGSLAMSAKKSKIMHGIYKTYRKRTIEMLLSLHVSTMNTWQNLMSRLIIEMRIVKLMALRKEFRASRKLDKNIALA